MTCKYETEYMGLYICHQRDYFPFPMIEGSCRPENRRCYEEDD